jgi:hypothetical protein
VAMTHIDEAPRAKVQHREPCHDCPMRRNALNGWLGGSTPEQYAQLCHSNAIVDCHAIRGAQCAGVAIYRANVYKRCDPPNLVLPADRDGVFETPMEFVEHHKARVGTITPRK